MSFETLHALRDIRDVLGVLTVSDTPGRLHAALDDLGQQLDDLVRHHGGVVTLNDLETHLVQHCARTISALARQHPSMGRPLRSR